jgi:hypothetical protein
MYIQAIRISDESRQFLGTYPKEETVNSARDFGRAEFIHGTRGKYNSRKES